MNRPKSTIGDQAEAILKEIGIVLGHVRHEEVEVLMKEITRAHRVVTAGAGRVGLATKGFAMRLGHLGFNAYALGDMTVPGISDGDLLIVASGSGETPTIAHIVEVAKKSGARIALITSNPLSRMGKVADVILEMPAPNKSSTSKVQSRQPMTTLNEQCLGILFDGTVLLLMEQTGNEASHMWERHSNLE